VGCGLIAQVMHLPYLTELGESYHIGALCDPSAPVAVACASRYHVKTVHTSWQDLVAERLDVVMVLTSGSHAPIAVAAAQAGSHVFVEKPMCLNLVEGREMYTAARDADVRLMVGNMKRYDPALGPAAVRSPPAVRECMPDVRGRPLPSRHPAPLVEHARRSTSRR
jgi:predicted dehydrogenase